VAFIGGERAGFAIEQTRALGFRGEMWPVNPTRSELGGVRTYPTLDELPGVPDAAFVAVDRVRTIEVVGALAAGGCGGAVCYASGFAESGPEGEALQRRLVEAAGEMPFIGPNCHGYVNALSGAVLWPDVQGCRPVSRGAAIITQSGNLAINITMQRRGLALSHVITIGNQAGIGIEDCLAHLIEDERVTAVGLHVEGLRDPVAFARAAIRAGRLHKPIVVLKTGLTGAGAAIARTHTATLAGSADAYRALFARYGVAQADSVPQLLSMLSVLGTFGRLPGNRLTSLSCSGGEAGLIADRAAGRSVVFPEFTPEVAARIGETLSNRVPITNPLDYHTFIWGDRTAMTSCFTETLAGGVDAGMLVIDFPIPDADDTWWWPTLESFVDAHRATRTPVVVTSTLPENLPEKVAIWLTERGVPAVPGIDDALAALEAASAPHPGVAIPHASAPPAAGMVRMLGEHELKRRLGAAGVPVPQGVVVPRSGVDGAAAEIGFPVVLKALGIAHKSESGAVVVGIGGHDDLERAAVSMSHLGAEFLVERYHGGAVAELVVGIRRESPVGWTVTVGSGGVLVELFSDAVTLLAPLDRAELERAIESLKVNALIEGHRGARGGDMKAAVDAIFSIVRFVLDTPSLVELEVNPLLVMTEGAWAVDALGVEEEGSA
jgi:acetyl-CoA synthetase